jgi:hypothetical protein
LKITVLPLDSRPCNHSWVRKFSKLAEVELAIIPEEFCGNLHQGFDFLPYEEWLMAETKNSDYLILSVDGLVSGGLIQARQAKMEMQEALRRLSLLPKIKHQNTNIKILAFDTIMRTSISTTDFKSRVYWEKMNKFSRLTGKLHYENDEATKDELDKLLAEIPSEIVVTYLKARQKKHEINFKLCELVEEGILDHLILLQEDSMKQGMQRIESDKLMEFVRRNSLEDKIMLYNGTDEATVVLLAKALLEDKGLKPRVNVLLSDERIKAKIMPFEDRELEKNYTNLINVIGLESVSYNKADYVLAIYSEADNPYDLNLESTEVILPDVSRKFYDFVVNVNQAIRAKKQVQFVDLLYPNGGSWDVISAFDYNKFLGYSAWNTASNSLGSALATIAVNAYANKNMKSFLYERIIDDCLYQTYSRREVNVMLLKDYVNIYDLNELQKKEALFLIEDNLKALVNKYLKVDFNITLPWARTFEIDIDVEVE